MSLVLILASAVLAWFAAKWLLFTAMSRQRALRQESTASLYFGQTDHVRFLPIVHGFEYPVVYLGVDLSGRARSGGSWISRLLFDWSSDGSVRSIFSFYAGDYMALPREVFSSVDLFHKVVGFVERKTDKSRSAAIKRIHFVSMPRVFGYSFNPVSFYYCYDSKEVLLFLVLEVHNTFGESHLYVLDCIHGALKTPRKGYGWTFQFPRNFHVSPFNDISGDYAISTTEPSVERKVDVHMLYIYDTPKRKEKKFMAFIQATAFPLSIVSTLYFFLVYPATIFLTVPRISYEAARLAYFKYLKIYPRPDPTSFDTIVKLKPDSVEAACMRHVLKALDAVLQRYFIDIGIQFQQPSTSLPLLQVGNPEATKQLEVKLLNYDLFIWTFYHADAREGLQLLFAENRWTLEKSEDLAVLLKVFECLSFSSSTLKLAQRFFIDKLLFPSAQARTTKPVTIELTTMDSLEALFNAIQLLLFCAMFNAITPWAEDKSPAPWVRLGKFRDGASEVKS